MADAMLSNHKQESEDSRNKNSQKTQQTSKKESSKKKSGEKSSSSPTIKASSSSSTVEADVHVAHVEPEGSTKQNATANLTLADVMSCLKGMENDQNKTENKLNDLSDKVSEMYDEYENYDENQLLYGDDANDDQNNRVDNSVITLYKLIITIMILNLQLSVGRLLMDSQRLRIMKR